MNDIAYLVALVLLPLIIPLFAIALILGSGSWVLEKLQSTLALREELGLAEQGLLWLSIISPFLYFLTFGAISWYQHSISLTSDGLKVFFSISKLPLGALSLSLPLSVLVSRLHATKQTAKQIKITQQKNNIDLFHSHRKELFSYFAQIGEVEYLGCLKGKFKVHPRVHKNFFSGKVEDGVPLINQEAFEEIESELLSARCDLDLVIRDVNPRLTYSLYIANLCSTLYRLSQKLGLPEIYVELSEKSTLVPVTLDGKEVKLLTVGRTTDEAVAAYRYAISYFYNLCDFAGRETSLKLDEKFKYLEVGANFRTLNEQKVIERLHDNEIKKTLEAKI